MPCGTGERTLLIISWNASIRQSVLLVIENGLCPYVVRLQSAPYSCVWTGTPLQGAFICTPPTPVLASVMLKSLDFFLRGGLGGVFLQGVEPFGG